MGGLDLVAAMPTRNRQHKRDGKSPKRPQIGYKVEPSTGLPSKTQARFNFGDDPKEREYRKALVKRLYEENCTVNGSNCWSPLALGYARLVEKGETEIPFPVDGSLISDPMSEDERAAVYAQTFRWVQRAYPCLRFVPTDEALYLRGCITSQNQALDRFRGLHRQMIEEGALPSTATVPESTVGGSFHEAVDAYADNIKLTGVRSEEGVLAASQQSRLSYCKRIKEHSGDFPLFELTYDKAVEIKTYWSNRPVGIKGDRYSATSARHVVKEIERFFRWLDGTAEFDWVMPRNLDNQKAQIVDTEEDRRSPTILSKPTYSVEELKWLVAEANSFDRLLLFVGVNCAFGAAELGRLQAHDILFNYSHEYADRLNFKTTDSDCFIRYLRPKSRMFGEWLLWSETSRQLQWAIERQASVGGKCIVCTKTGEPLYRPESRNAQSGFQRRWTRLNERVSKKRKSFKKLPFGSLRDLLPSILRHHYDDTLASICLAHRTSYKPDRLLDAYADKPFGRLHTAIRELHERFVPVFEVAAQEECHDADHA